MKITKIYKQKKGSGINIDVDYVFYFSLKNKNTLVDENIYIGKPVEDDDIAGILNTDVMNVLKERALSLAFTGHKSSSEIKRKLSEKAKLYTSKLSNKDFIDKIKSVEIVEKVFSELLERNYLNDEGSAKNFVNKRLSYRPRGSLLLRQELKAKGFDDDSIKKSLSPITTEIEIASAKDLVTKKERLLKKEDKTEKYAKLYNFLARKGFKSDIIRTVLKEMF